MSCLPVYNGIKYNSLEEVKEIISDNNSIYIQKVLKSVDSAFINELLHDIPVKEDMFDSLSLLLTGAVDNAKELVLSKINASKELLPYHVVLLFKGVDFKDICRLMSSGEVSLIAGKLRNSLIYDTQRTVTQAISHYIDGVDPSFYVDSKYLNSLNNIAKNFIKTVLKIDSNLPEIFGSITAADYKNSEFKTLVNYLANLEDTAHFEELKNDIRLRSLTDFSESEYLKSKKNSGTYVSEDLNQQEFDEFDYEPFEDDTSDIIEHHSSNYKVNKDIKYKIFRYFDEAVSRKYELKGLKNDINAVEANFKLIKNLEKDVNELALLKSFLQYNQGIKVNIEDKIKATINLENKVSRTFKETELTRAEVDNLRNTFEIKGNIFSIKLFVENEAYRNEIIELYDLFKVNINFLDLVAKSSQYMSILKAINIDNDILNNNSKKYRETNKILRLNPGIVVNKKNVNSVIDFLNEAMIVKFLKGMNKPFNISNNDLLYNGNSKIVISQLYELDFSNPDHIRSFKNWVENYFLNNVLRSRFKENSFVKNLQKSSIKTNLGNTMSSLKMAFDLVLDKNEVNEVINGVIQDFSKIRGEKIDELHGNYTIEDVLYLYNLIVNKDKIGAFTLTNLFKDLSLESKNSVGSMYTTFIGNISASSEGDLLTFDGRDYNIEDLYINYNINDRRTKVEIDPDKETLEITMNDDNKTVHTVFYKDNSLVLPNTFKMSYRQSKKLEQEFIGSVLELINGNKLEILLC